MLLFLGKQVAAEVAAPLSQAKKVTMVTSGNSEVGASKLTNEVMDIMVKVPGMIKDMTGVDISKVISYYFVVFIKYFVFNV